MKSILGFAEGVRSNFGSMGRNHSLGFAILGVWGSSERGAAMKVWRWWRVVAGGPGGDARRGNVRRFRVFTLGLLLIFPFLLWLLNVKGRRKENNKGSGKDHGLWYQFWYRTLWEQFPHQKESHKFSNNLTFIQIKCNSLTHNREFKQGVHPNTIRKPNNKIIKRYYLLPKW